MACLLFWGRHFRDADLRSSYVQQGPGLLDEATNVAFGNYLVNVSAESELFKGRFGVQRG
jgi:hypothetical protein